jgi:hypothetical protein
MRDMRAVGWCGLASVENSVVLAEEVKRLRVEIERLRDALDDFSRGGCQCENDPNPGEDAIYCIACRARDALTTEES